MNYKFMGDEQKEIEICKLCGGVINVVSGVNGGKLPTQEEKDTARLVRAAKMVCKDLAQKLATQHSVLADEYHVKRLGLLKLDRYTMNLYMNVLHSRLLSFPDELEEFLKRPQIVSK